MRHGEVDGELGVLGCVLSRRGGVAGDGTGAVVLLSRMPALIGCGEKKWRGQGGASRQGEEDRTGEVARGSLWRPESGKDGGGRTNSGDKIRRPGGVSEGAFGIKR